MKLNCGTTQLFGYGEIANNNVLVLLHSFKVYFHQLHNNAISEIIYREGQASHTWGGTLAGCWIHVFDEKYSPILAASVGGWVDFASWILSRQSAGRRIGIVKALKTP